MAGGLMGPPQGRVTLTPAGMNRLAADRRAGVKAPRPLTEKQQLARRKAEAAFAADMPAIMPSSFDRFLRFDG